MGPEHMGNMPTGAMEGFTGGHMEMMPPGAMEGMTGDQMGNMSPDAWAATPPDYYPPLENMDFSNGGIDGGWGDGSTDLPIGQPPAAGMPPMNDPMGDIGGAPGDVGGLPIDPGLDAAVSAIDATAAAGMAENAPDIPADIGNEAGVADAPQDQEPNDVV